MLKWKILAFLFVSFIFVSVLFTGAIEMIFWAVGYDWTAEHYQSDLLWIKVLFFLWLIVFLISIWRGSL